MTLTPVEYEIARLVASGMNYPTIAKYLADHPSLPRPERAKRLRCNARIIRHYAAQAADKVDPNSKHTAVQRLTLWWERRKG